MDGRTSLSDEKTDTDYENHLKIAEGFLHRKGRKHPLHTA